MIIRWNGRASTPVTLCASSQPRWADLSRRKVKKSAKMRRWVTRPEISATSMIMAQPPTIHRPQSGGRFSSKWKR